MKNILLKSIRYILLLGGLILFILNTGVSHAESYVKEFKISAYYSPLPCQNRYATGSYEGDIRLNGHGIHGADGTNVYPGMIAAPKIYSFGTKINIPGLGTGTVHDRGGAIVSASDVGKEGFVDRLDIWMGYGDVGLKRALNWGKRNIYVTVYGVDASISDNLTLSGYSDTESIANSCSSLFSSESNSSSSNAAATISSENNSAIADPDYISELFKNDLKLGSSGLEVEMLQYELNNLNFYKEDINGLYDDVVVHAVFKFQQSQNILANEDDFGAGAFGPKTRNTLNSILKKRNENQELIASKNDGKIKNSYIAYNKNLIGNQKESGYLLAELDFGANSDDVKKLQEFLKNNGYFSGQLTSYFGENTKSALIKFQLENNIIDSESDKGAGRVGPSTLKMINSLA